jgi:hypothetical protein
MSRSAFTAVGTAFGAAALLLSVGAHAAQMVQAAEPADVCPALRHIVSASNFKQLHDEPDAQLPGLASADDCRANSNAYDCHWRAHWQADGVVTDPLEELGADIAACFPNVVHDLGRAPHQRHGERARVQRIASARRTLSVPALRFILDPTRRGTAS